MKNLLSVYVNLNVNLDSRIAEHRKTILLSDSGELVLINLFGSFCTFISHTPLPCFSCQICYRVFCVDSLQILPRSQFHIGWWENLVQRFCSFAKIIRLSDSDFIPVLLNHKCVYLHQRLLIFRLYLSLGVCLRDFLNFISSSASAVRRRHCLLFLFICRLSIIRTSFLNLVIFFSW